MAELDLTTVKRIAVDETSSRRGHRYITLFVDVDTKLVLFATEGKGMDTLERNIKKAYYVGFTAK